MGTAAGSDSSWGKLFFSVLNCIYRNESSTGQREWQTTSWWGQPQHCMHTLTFSFSKVQLYWTLKSISNFHCYSSAQTRYRAETTNRKFTLIEKALICISLFNPHGEVFIPHLRWCGNNVSQRTKNPLFLKRQTAM